MPEYIYLIIAVIFVILKNLYDKQKVIKKYNAVRVTYNCKGHFNHEHRLEFTAKICGFWQWLINMHVLDPWITKKFFPEKYNKILHAWKGRNKRAAKRRIARGRSAI